MKMYKGSEVVEVHPSNIDVMLNRGWKDKKPTAKKTTTKEVTQNG